jgi:hypothetical protein
MFQLKTEGDFSDTTAWLEQLKAKNIFANLEKYGQMGVDALAKYTPKDSGKTAESWGYETSESRGAYSLKWFNTNVNDGEQIAILIQYGHGTGTGGYVYGEDYINPAMQPIFDMIIDEFRTEVSR